LREQTSRQIATVGSERPLAQPNYLHPLSAKETANAAVSLDARFVLCSFCVGAQTISIGVLDSTARIADFRKLGHEQKLLAHFGKTGTAIFLIQKIE